MKSFLTAAKSPKKRQKRSSINKVFHYKPNYRGVIGAKESPDSTEQCTGEQPGDASKRQQTVPQKITAFICFGKGHGGVPVPGTGGVKVKM